MLLIRGKVSATITTEEFNFPQDVGLISIQGKAAIFVLEITAGKNNTISHLQKIFIVAANRAGYFSALGMSR